MKSTAVSNAMSELYLRNRQRTRPINLKLLERIAATLVTKTCPADFRIGILLVGARQMTQLNEAFLKHGGPTDVIAFGYATDQCRSLHGEIFICVEEALRQARRFRTTWQKEVVRYLAHGLLHFQGYDDSTPAERGRMKRVENSLVQELAGQFCLSQLSRKPKVRT
jgi:rRNA maturation RNase YbeY